MSHTKITNSALLIVSSTGLINQVYNPEVIGETSDSLVGTLLETLINLDINQYKSELRTGILTHFNRDKKSVHLFGHEFMGVDGKPDDVAIMLDSNEKLYQTHTSMQHESEARLAINKMLRTSLIQVTLETQLTIILESVFSVPWFSLNPKGSIFLVNEATGNLNMVAEVGLPDYIKTECETVKSGYCLCGKALQRKEVVFTNHLDHEHDVVNKDMKNHGHYCVPIQSKDKMIGILNLYINPGHTRTQKEDEFLDMTSTTIASLVERRSLEVKIREQAEFDALTGLPNRSLFNDRLSSSVLSATRNKTEVVVLFIDLDKFKFVNDSLGHKAGDQLLQEVSERIQSCIRTTDTVSRLGGDEFTVILPKLTNVFYVEFVVMRILQELEKPFDLKEGVANISGSIGISIFPRDAKSKEELIKNADIAMYNSKETGRSTFSFFEESMTIDAMKRLKMEEELRTALENNELVVYYQSKVSPIDHSLVGVEALVRWSHPTGKLIPPDEFISLAERTGLIFQLDEHVLRTACFQNKQWMDSGHPKIRVSVNTSAYQFSRGQEFYEVVKGILEETELPPNYLEIEVTESMMIDNKEEAIALMEGIKHMGVGISIDDFGTGYSSLSFLKKMPIQVLKIDKSFVFDLEKDSNSVAVVSAIISLATQLGLKVIAEGVETENQANILRDLGCDEFQGYLFSKPVSAVNFEKAFNNNLLK